MYVKVRNAIVTLIALVTFMVIGAQMVWDWQTWECECTHVECEWCNAASNLYVWNLIPESGDEDEWEGFHADAVQEYADEFTALFNSYETKVAKNGRMMIRVGSSGRYSFAKK